jgi:hypothetical protein
MRKEESTRQQTVRTTRRCHLQNQTALSTTKSCFDPLPFTMADPNITTSAASTPDSGAIIDLCGGDDDPAAQYAKTMTESLSQNRKRARCKDAPCAGAGAAPVDGPDAIEIDIGGYNAAAIAQQQDPSVKYRQELGPIRFDFVDSFKGQHAYFRHAQGQQPATGTLQTNKLYKELLEYKLNLPIELSSSIFVRVCESRMDLIRALITGTSIVL